MYLAKKYNPRHMNEEIKRAALAIKNANALMVASGAGMGVDSGLPDFRGDEGFWKAYPPIAKLGISFSSMANPYWFKERPHLAWAFYGHRFNLYNKTVPHKGFHELLELGENMPFGYFVFTSNVDGHFQRAGYQDDQIYEVHGSINHFQCLDRCSDDIWEAEDEIIVDEEKFEAHDPLPKCPHCGQLARPNILMFSDFSWNYLRSGEQEEAYSRWINEIRESYAKLVIIEIGAGGSVPTVRHNSKRMSAIKDAVLIRINPREPEVHSPNHISIPLGATEAIQKIMEELKKL